VSRDVDEVRELLGFHNINIYGSSTGAGTVISYLRYYPESVRSIILGWPWFGEYRNRPAIDEFYTIKQMYTDILGLCVARDPHCRELIPAWYYEIDRARRVLDEKPYRKTVQTEDGETVTLSFDGVAFMGRTYRYFEDVYMKLPNVLARVQRDDYSALDGFFETDRWTEVSADDSDNSTPYGYYLAHICGDMGTNRPTKEDVIAMLEREPALLGFEDNKICAWWGADGAVPPNHNDRFYSDVPGLSLHGQVDSCCGIRWGYYVAKTMPNLQLVELQGLGHGVPGECRSRLIASFLEDPYAQVDDSCKNDVPLGPWVLK
jgi:pimeloyl-ACP methyl ester carboxylesterase